MTEWHEPLFEKVLNQMDENKIWLDGSIPIYIYGTGTFAQDVYGAMLQKGRHVSAYLDHRQPLPYSVNGVPVMQPDVARDAIVLIGIHNRDADVLSITRKLEESGCKYIVSTVEIYDFLGDLLGVRYWLTKRIFYSSCRSQIAEAYSLLSDEKSRELYSSILRFRLTGDHNLLPTPDMDHQYFPPDIPEWKTPLRLVDCGAFDGDTLASFIGNGFEIEAVAAFEPDMKNYEKLSKYMYQHKDRLGDVTLFPCGVHSTTSQMTFETNLGSASNISSTGKSIIQCVALDDAVPTFAPNLIKMDIEGAEHSALLGARKLIVANTPGIAASLYHRPEHLWQLPILVNSIAPGKYNFYMRSHAMNDFELVLYCVSSIQ